MQNVAVAKNNHVRISAQKVKIVIDLIRNKPVGQALAILRNTPKAASEPVEKLLLSAMANAENNHNMDVEALYVAEVFANQGPTMKRIQPRAQGRAFRILKRTSHITIVLKEKEMPQTPVKAETAKKATKAKTKKEETKKEEAVSAEKPKAEKKEPTAKKPRAPRKKATEAAEKPAEAVVETKDNAADDAVQE